ncbi:helix-turn-helix domain-containing protein [Streptomyces sp. HNM0663]|uniref:Helix-turn-helix domain-containing protein n=1 Tax=Streptomyces chengmaiensis TaxID=3040919 RepID=A0ABT6HYU9_9ACTN|nr:helix-turn-helix transcriptional regulator [Streptomyces chengmaiensis]MDH2393867.1 helix-turn-helix domain-containing protein [Streptomyces chengmaiensis]
MTEHHDENLPQPARSLEEERREFARRLADLRSQTGMSLQECAELLNVNKTTIRNYELDEDPRVPPLEYLTLLIQEAQNRTNVTPDVLHDTHRAYGHLLQRLAQSGSDAVHHRMWTVFDLTQQREELIAKLGSVHHQMQGLITERDRYRQTVHDGHAPDPAQEQHLEEQLRQLELRRADLCARRDGLTAQLDALGASQAQPAPRPNATPAPPSPVPDLGVVTPQPPSAAALPPGTAPQAPKKKSHTTTKVVAAAAIVALALGGFLIYRITEPDTTTASTGGNPGKPQAPASPPATPTPQNTPSPTSQPTTDTTPTTDPDDPETAPESPTTPASAPPPPEEDGYLVTWNAEYSSTSGSFTIDRTGDPNSFVGVNDLDVQSNSGVDPYITPGHRNVSLGVVPSGDPIPGPSACSDIATKQQIFRHELAAGNRYCVKANDTIGHFEVVNVKRTGEMNIFLIRWQPS